MFVQCSFACLIIVSYFYIVFLPDTVHIVSQRSWVICPWCSCVLEAGILSVA